MFKRKYETFVANEPSDISIWHLIDRDSMCEKLSTFCDDKLWLARIDQFGDHLEGTFSKPTLGLFEKTFSGQINIIDGMKNMIENFALTSYASCWHMSVSDPTDYAWKKFGGSGNGIALKTSLSSIRKSLKIDTKKVQYHIGKIRYMNHDSDMMSDLNMLDAFFCVQDTFKNEQEVRLLLSTSGQKTATLNQMIFKDCKSLLLPCKADVLIEEIIIGDKMSNSARRCVEKLLTGNLNKKIRK